MVAWRTNQAVATYQFNFIYREVLEERMREIMRASISTMICGLAVNIRIYRDVALLLQTDGRIETQVDVPVGDGMQKPIEFR